MKFKFKKLLAVGLMSLAAAGASQAAQLVVAVDTAFVPFEFKQGDKYVGFDIDLWDAVAKELKLDYRLQPMDFNGILPALQTKNVDVALAGITIKDERKKVIDFSDGYYDSGFMIMVPANSKINGGEDLDGKQMAMKTGTLNGFPGIWMPRFLQAKYKCYQRKDDTLFLSPKAICAPSSVTSNAKSTPTTTVVT